MSTRTLFESKVTSDFPSICEMLNFVETRVAILELVGDPSHKINRSSAVLKPVHGDQSRKGGDRYKRQQTSQAASLVTAAPSKTCPCCTEPHLLESCTRFKSWSVEKRARWTRENKLCFVCFNAGHWANNCKSKTRCHQCNRRHHHVVHIHSGDQRNREDEPRSDTSLCTSAALHQSISTSVVLGTALVHVLIAPGLGKRCGH